jgi:2-polyprenyl-3-methyl-5-hydroxy-6-metoxy-1,4-benzoquinol methylase
MQYDPIKRSLGNVFNKTPFLRILFYRLLDLLLLRSWHVKKEIRRWAKTAAPAKRELLDAGSGFGQYSYFMSGLNPSWVVDAVDVKEEQIADCNAFFRQIGRNNVKFEVADLTKFSKPNRFDLILSVDVMEHILEDEAVFKNFFDSLKPGGMLIVSTPSDQGGSDVHDHDHEGSFIDEHVRDGYNITEICDKLKRAGFTRTEAAYTYGTPGQIGWKLSMKYPILMLNASKIFFVILPFYYIVAYPIAFVCNWLDCRMKHATGTGLIVTAFA